MKRIAAAMLGMTLLVGCAAQDAQERPKQTMGTVLGAVGGALLGSQVGKGEGRLVGVAVGTLAGAYIGGQIGRSMDEVDRMKARETTQRSLEYNKDGNSSSWSNPNSGHSGTVTPTRTYYSDEDRPCREYTTQVTIEGRTETAKGNACRQPDGTWRIVN
jgi:surface antigen